MKSPKLLSENLKHITSAFPNQSEIDIDAAAGIWGCERYEALETFKQLDAAGLVRLIVGRHGYKTRAVVNEISEIDATPIDFVNSQQGCELIEYPFVIRPEIQISFKLPKNLTPAEAERLSNFIKSLVVI